MEFYYFNDYIFQIFECSISETKEVTPKHFHGTGFFVGCDGYFLSAKHVIGDEDLSSMTAEKYFGIIINSPLKKQKKAVKVIRELEKHPEYDIVIGKVNHMPESFFSSENDDAYGWEDVHCFGYPEHLSKNDDDMYTLEGQFSKGYIMRRVSSVNMPGLGIPPSYELNFPIPRGVSGSPIFRIGAKKSLLGVALKSHDSILSQYEISEIRDGDKHTIEKVAQVRQLGIAARIHELRDWKPNILSGKSLSEIY